ncbi:transposase [Paraburkholderia sp. RAU6.4a]
MKKRRPYPTDVSDEEWYFAAPYLTLMNRDAPQRRYELREMFNALRWIVRAGAPWRLLPNDFPPWELVYQQTQRWIQAGCFEATRSPPWLFMQPMLIDGVPPRNAFRRTAHTASGWLHAGG